MSIKYDLAVKVIDDLVEKGEEFSLKETTEKIDNQRLFYKVVSRIIRKNYLRKLDKLGVVKYFPHKKKYIKFNEGLEETLEK
ncbi:hypothetical protein KAI04_02475 [Candidatus Pacearchaeota archaeon]|nr:hypothetical protein [Candidatus Pacearchaeota archaeon]